MYGSGFDGPALAFGLPVGERFGFERNLHGLRLAGLQGDALEALQLLLGPLHRRTQVFHVELHHLVARAVAGVGHVEAHGQFAVRRKVLDAQAQVAVGKRGVAQAEAERVQRLTLEIHIRPPVAQIVVQARRQLLDAVGPRLHQPAAGIDVAKEHVGQRVAQLLAVVRHVDNSRHVALCPRDGEGEAADQHDDGVRVGAVDLLDQFLLLQDDGAAVHGLLAVARRGALGPAGVAGGMVAHADDSDVGLARGVDGGIIRIVFGVNHARSVPHPGADAVQRGHGVGRIAAVPVQQHLAGAASDDGDRFKRGFIQRQQVIFVLQQDDGFLRHQPGERLVFLAFPGQFGFAADRVVRHKFRRIEHAQLYHHAEDAAQHRVEVGLGQPAVFDGGVDALAVTVEELVDARFDDRRRGHIQVGIVVVARHQQGKRAAVGADDAVLPPLVHRNRLEDGVYGAGDAVVGVVRRHVRPRAAVHDAHAEGDGVVFAEEALVEIGR